MGKKLLSVVTLLCAAVMVVSIVKIVGELKTRRQEREDADALSRLLQTATGAQEEATAPSSGRIQPAVGEGQTDEDTLLPSKRDLAPLFEENADCVGWIHIDGTAVDYPVMYTPEDPQKYILRNFDGAYSPAGVPFIDGKCTPDGGSLIIYGHNLRNSRMFSQLLQYRQESYLAEHPTVEFETAQGLRIYRIFAVVSVKKTDPWYSTTAFDSEAQFDSAVASIKRRALYDTGVTPHYPEKLLTLSTCSGETSDSRLLVIGVSQRD